MSLLVNMRRCMRRLSVRVFQFKSVKASVADDCLGLSRITLAAVFLGVLGNEVGSFAEETPAAMPLRKK